MFFYEDAKGQREDQDFAYQDGNNCDQFPTCQTTAMGSWPATETPTDKRKKKSHLDSIGTL